MLSYIAAAAVTCLAFAATCSVAAVAAAPNVNITATGTFALPPVGGNDELRLAGQPFTINAVVNAAAVPIKNGPNWALYSPLKMSGQVHSALVGQTPVTISSAAASIQQAVGPDYDLLLLGFPVRIVGIELKILARITLPAGTLPNQLVHLFGPVQLTAGAATVTYADSAGSTTLAIAKGTLSATIAKAATPGVRWAVGPAPRRTYAVLASQSMK